MANNKVYNAYRYNEQGKKTFMASIVKDQVIGPEATAVLKVLHEGFADKTWPETSPDEIIVGTYMWAEEV